MYEIEKGVPIPDNHNPYRKGITKLLRTMSIGDSFTFPYKRASGIRSIATRVSAESNMRFTSRTEGELVRLWRVS